MSLETELAANTAAITELIGAWKALTANAVAAKGADKVNAGGVAVIEKVESPKSVAPAEALPSQENTGQGATAATETTVSPSEVTYEDVSKAVLAKMKTDKPAVMAAAAKFSVKNAKELKPEQWADFLKEIA